MIDLPEAEDMLLDILSTRDVLVNCHWWRSDWPDAARDTFALAVNCNDMFFPATADCEPFLLPDLPVLWKMWKRDGARGVCCWCVMKRKREPWSRALSMIDGAPWALADLLSGSIEEASL